MLTEVLDRLSEFWTEKEALAISGFAKVFQYVVPMPDIFQEVVNAIFFNKFGKFLFTNDGIPRFQDDSDERMTFLKVIGIFLLFLVNIGKWVASPETFIFEFNKIFNFGNLTRYSGSLSALVNGVVWMVDKIKVEYLGMEPSCGISWIRQNKKMIFEFIDESLSLKAEGINSILSDPEKRRKVISMAPDAQMILKNVIVTDKSTNYVRNLKETGFYIQQLADQCRKTPPTAIRVRPTVITFMGEPQCGKTYLSSHVVSHYVAEKMGWADGTCFMINSSTDDFMSGYAQQPITMIDDFLQMREGKDLNGFMNMIGNAPYRVNMASLEEKGTQFLSELLILTMNQTHPKVDQYITEPRALYNRMYEHCFFVELKIPKIDKDRMGDRFVHPDSYLNFYRQRMENGVRIPDQAHPKSGEKVLFKDIINEIVQGITNEQRIVNSSTRSHEDDSRPNFFPSFDDLDDYEQQSIPVFQSATTSPYKKLCARITSKIARVLENETHHKGKMDILRREFQKLYDLRFFESTWITSKVHGNLRSHVAEEGWKIPINDYRPEEFRGEWFSSDMFAFHGEDKMVGSMDPEHRRCYGPEPMPANSGIGKAISFLEWVTNTERVSEQFDGIIASIKKYSVFIMKVAAGMTATAMVGYWLFGKGKEENPVHQVSWYSAGSPASGGKRKMDVRRVANPIRPKVPIPSHQDTEFPGIGTYLKNTVQLRGNGKVTCGFAWKKNLILLNKHFVDTLPEGTIIQVQRRSHDNGSLADYNYEVTFDSKNCAQLSYEEGDTDVVLWNTGWTGHSFPDMTKHIISASDLSRIDNQSGYKVGNVCSWVPKMRFIANQKTEASDGSFTTTPLSICGNGRSTAGACGNPWIVHNPKYFGSIGKMIGIHTWGNGTIMGASPVCIEHLLALEEMLPISLSPSTSTKIVKEDVPPHFQEAIETNHFLGTVGKEDRCHQPTKTAIKPSPVHGEIFPITHEPAVLSPKDPRLDKGVDFDADIIKKTNRQTFWFRDVDEVNQVVEAMKDEFTQFEGEKRLLTLDEAINGVDGTSHGEEAGLEMRNSPGYPYNFKHGKGKYPYFKELPQKPGERLKYEINDPALLERIKKRIDLAKKGEVIEDSYYIDVKKDELRPLEKIKIGGTRVVNAPPLDKMIVWNMYFGAFRIMFMNPDYVGFPLESALGVEPKKIWPEMGLKMRQCPHFFGVDYSKFDSTQSPVYYEKIVDIINHWYGGSEEDNQVRRTLFYEVGHTMHIYGDSVYLDDHALPSGVCGGFTTITNIMVNKIISRIAYVRTGMPIQSFKKYVTALFMGDDNWQHVDLNNEHREKLEKYNRLTLAKVAGEVGMIVTNPDKSDKLTALDTIENCTFLKQGFNDKTVPGFYVPAMDVKTIHNLINWYRPAANPEQFTENVDNALDFAAGHGRLFYDDFVKQLKSNVKFNLAIGNHQIRTFDQTFNLVYMNPETNSSDIGAHERWTILN